MFTTAHVTSGVAVGLILGLNGAPLATFIAASVLVDWDYVIQHATGRNHRTLLSHSPAVVAAVLAIAAFIHPLAWWALAGAMLHFSLDVWDSGLRLNPFSRRTIGFQRIPGIERMPFGDYIRVYFTDHRFLVAELALATAAITLAMLRWT